MFAETSGKERWEMAKGTQMEGNKRKERILIRNLRKKIIRLADSKCQHQDGEQMEEAHAHTDTQTQVEKGGREASRRRQVGPR